MPIDYSKWDNLDVSSSEDEDEKATPSVTRLDAPSRVTFGGGGGDGLVSVSPERTLPKLQSHSSSTETAVPHLKPSTRPLQGDRDTPLSWTDHGGILESTNDDPKHGSKRNLFWAQDRYSVTLRLELVGAEKVRSVVVEGILPYSERWSAVGSTKQKLVCVSTESTVLLDGELPHPVYLAEEDSDDGLVDWSVVVRDSKGGERRFLAITLHKAVPMQGLSLWWRRPLMDFPEVDLDVVKGDSDSSGKSGGGSREFLSAWEEAHKMFREGKQKRAERKPAI